MAGTITYPAMWFTSNTPITEGQRHCRMARYLGYHAGAHGTGWRRKSLSVPLATGGAVHRGVELIAEWVLDYQAAHHGMPPAPSARYPLGIPAPVVAWAATEAAAQYEASARKRGFEETALTAVGVDDVDPATLPPAVETLILEQRTLIEGLIWLWAIVQLPGLLGPYRVLDSEREEGLILDCSCGLGDAVADIGTHHARGCTGIVVQGRADLLLESTVSGQVTYQEIKTKASPNYPWEKAWEHSGQLRVNMEAARRRLGREVAAGYIPTLFKGKRMSDRDDPAAPRRQDSPICYGWFDEGSPGFRPEAWAAAYKFQDDYGKNHTLGKNFVRTPVWDLSVTLPLRETNLIERGVEVTRVGQWVTQYLTPLQRAQIVKVLGPFPFQASAIPLTLQSIQVEEDDWRDRVRLIRGNAAELHLSDVELADAYVSRSWNCTPFGGEPCMFKPICERASGWQTPETMGVYEFRTPHHAPEREAFEAGGVVFPAPEDDEFEEVDL